eukprot:s5691_g2.t1
MEIDRVDGGKSKGKNKGKNQKGKGDKGSGKNNAKGASKGSWGSGGKGKNKGKSSNSYSKGKGKGDQKVCFQCGSPGHYAKDCWNAVRAAQTGQSGDNGQTAQHASQSQPPVQQQQQQPTQQTQYRVARIGGGDDSPTRVFDLRSMPSSPTGSVKVVQQFYIGDDDVHFSTGHVNAVIQPIPDGSDLQSILLDSGADASVFPLQYAQAGTSSSVAKMKLHDAQGREIPVVCMRDLEISLLDQNGHLVTIREHGAVSPLVTQPILCFGKLLQNGWGVCGTEQSLYHPPTETRIPIELQNQSMIIQGWIRAIGSTDDDAAQAASNIRAIKADVFGGMDRGEIGWHLEADGTGVGRHYSDHFMDPL